MLPVYNYLLHLIAACALLGVFTFLYTKVTPFDELHLIRQGMVAPALSLGGAMLGFSLTLAAGIVYSATLAAFAMWAVLAGLVQVAAYAVLSRVQVGLAQALSEDNIAMGALMGAVSLVVGIINAACMS